MTSPVSLREYRKRAYRFILDQSRNVNPDIPVQGTNPEDHIPLEELEGLKLGLADPSPNLIENCRRIFGQNVEPPIFEEILVTPFSTGMQAGH